MVPSIVVMLILVLAPSTVTHASGPVSGGMCEVAATPVAFGMYDPLRQKEAVTVGMLRYDALALISA